MIRKLFCLATGYRYHYRVNLKYISKDNRIVLELVTDMSVTSPEFLKEHRQVKKAMSGAILKHLGKNQLRNGKIQYEPVFYVGLFRQARK